MPDGELGDIKKDYTHPVDLVDEDVPPVKKHPYTYTHSHLDYMRDKLSEMLNQGIIKPSKSSWASPLIVVEQPLHESQPRRLCIDYRYLNSVTKKHAYILPNLDHCINKLNGKLIYTLLDIKSAFYQFRLRPQDMHLTAFCTPFGTFEFTRMPFGLCNAPATCQELTQRVVNDIELAIFQANLDSDVSISGYIDDFCIASKTMNGMLFGLETTLKTFIEYGIKIAAKKCQFMKTEINFLGYVINANGRLPDPRKLDSIRNYPMPKNVAAIRSFLGLTGYYRRFIKDFSKLARPLTELTKSDVKFEMTQDRIDAFLELRKIVSSPPVIGHFDPALPLILHTDASLSGIGAVLMQEDSKGRMQLIQCASRALEPPETKMHINILEGIAIHWAICKQFTLYIDTASHVTCFSDNFTFNLAIRKIMPNKRFASIVMDLQTYPHITYRHFKGTENKVADALSRYPVDHRTDGSQAESYSIIATPKQTLQKSQLEDEFCARRIAVLQTKPAPNESRYEKQTRSDFALHNDVLLHKKENTIKNRLQIVIPNSIRPAILTNCHDKHGHSSPKRTLETIQKRFWWPNMIKDIVDYVQNCTECKMYNRNTNVNAGLLSPRAAPLQPATMFCTDHIGPLNETKNGKQFYIIFVDYTTKYAITDVVPDLKKQTTIEAFKRLILDRFGTPATLVHDAGSCFRSHDFQAYSNDQGIETIQAHAGYQQANGQAERTIQTIDRMLAKIVNAAMDDWDELLPLATLAYNATTHSATDFTPFYLLHGFEPRTPYLGWLAVTNDDLTLKERTKNLLDNRLIANGNIKIAQQRAKSKYDSKRFIREFAIGDMVVYVYQKQHVGSKRKFLPTYGGYYRVISRQDDNYLIEKLMPTTHERRLRTAHLSQLALAPKLDFSAIPKEILAIDENESSVELQPEPDLPTAPKLADKARQDVERRLSTRIAKMPRIYYGEDSDKDSDDD